MNPVCGGRLLFGLILLMAVFSGQAQEPGQVYRLNEGQSSQTLVLAPEFYQAEKNSRIYSAAPEGQAPLVATMKWRENQLRNKNQNLKYGAILHPLGNSSVKKFVTRGVLLHASSELEAAAAAKATGAGGFATLVDGKFYQLNFSTTVEALEAMRTASSTLRLEPLFERVLSLRSAPNDPLYAKQWHLKNTGQLGGFAGIDLNVESVWDTNTGQDVQIVIIDDSVQLTHPDLVPNLLPASAHFDFLDNDSNPNPDVTQDFHGTSVAGVAAACGGNGLGVSGVAPQAKIAAARLIGGAITDQQIASALLWRLSQSEISNNSWGPTDGIFAGFSSLVTNALQQCAVQGRSGKGRITVFAAGNGGPTDNSNYDGVANSRYVIAVGAITDLGIRTFYSEPGANILICAPSNGGVSGIYTTDLIGSNGYNSSNASIGLDYTDDFGGTSSASPAVAGVCALLLKQNPNLGWRDVKEILLSTATRVAASDSGWRRNGGGFYFNEFYGAGLVNAKLAVQTATNWTNLPPEISLTVDKQNLNTNIPDANVTGITTEFSLATGNNFRIEHVELHVGISHTYRGDLDIKLISPSGMESQLKRVSGDSTNDLDWTFSSVQFWGENPAGIWKLVIRDLVAIDSGKLLNAKLTLYGAQPRTTPPVIPPVIVIGGGSQVDTAKQIVNLSTRAFVNTGEGVEIGGIVVEGSTSKRVLIRALGPSLSPYLANFLKDPTIEVRNQQGTLIASNDDWKNGDLSKISQSGLAPSNNLEPALLLDLNPGNYTVIVKGYLDDVGVALVECYDLDGLAATRLANISTRASVGTGDNVTIAGFIIQGDTERNVVIRGIGPSLTNYGIVQALLDPMIELHDTNGDLLMSNDNWADTQRSLISGTGLSPVNTNESAIYVTLKPGSYTVILKGKNDTMGTGLVEVYEIR